MAYFAQNSRTEESGFEYPSPPRACTDSYSSFDANNGYDSRTPKHLSSAHPPFYQNHQAMAFPTPTPRRSPYQDHGLEVPVFGPIVSAISPASSSGHGSITPLASMDHTLSPAYNEKLKFVPSSAEGLYRKRPRGTTGSVVCDKCGTKFTVVSSLTRHNKICRGKKTLNKSAPTQRTPPKTKGATLIADHSDHDWHAGKPSHIPLEKQGQVGDPDSNYHTVPAASTLFTSPWTENPSLISDPNIMNPDLQNPTSATSNLVRGRDTPFDHRNFYCHLCPEVFARRDMLQMHQFRIHDFTEMPYLPESGAIDRPSFLTGVTRDNATDHSNRALRIWEAGGLSTSPCQPCIAKGMDCIVNPLVSSRCSFCCYRDDGSYCGAAGVKYL